MPKHDHFIEMPFRLAWLLKDIHHRRSNLVQMSLNTIGLHYGHPRILFTIDHLEGASQKEIADRLHVSPASLATSLKRLEKAGFLARSIDGQDQRVNKIELTDKGKEAVSTCHLQMQSMDRLMTAGFTDDEQNLLHGLLARLNDNLETISLADIEAAIQTDRPIQSQESSEVGT